MRLYLPSSALAGHASTRRPPPQTKSAGRLPRIDDRCAPGAKYARAAAASDLAAEAIWPQTNDFGKKRSAASDWNQSPLASPWSAASQAPSVIGPLIGAASCVVSTRP